VTTKGWEAMQMCVFLCIALTVLAKNSGRKYPEYACCIASGSDIDLVADVEVMETEEGISQ